MKISINFRTTDKYKNIVGVTGWLFEKESIKEVTEFALCNDVHFVYSILKDEYDDLKTISSKNLITDENFLGYLLLRVDISNQIEGDAEIVDYGLHYPFL